MIEHGKVVMPVGWAIMQRKNEDAYDAVINGIKEHLLPSFEPSWAMTDFEPALKNALKATFPTLTVHGCHFHHCHAILNYRQRLRIMTRVVKHVPNMHAEACCYEKDLMNLALLPEEYIAEAFDDLRKRLGENMALSEIMNTLFQYYETFWIKKKGPGSYTVYREQRRTNNAIERYHRSLKAEMATKPEFYEFIGALKNIQEQAHCDLLVVAQGETPHRPGSRKVQQRSNVLNVAWDDLGELSSYSRHQREKKYIRFLKDVRPDTVLSLERSSIDSEELTEMIDVTLPNIDIPETVVGTRSEDVRSNEYTISAAVCRHFVVGCTTCNMVEIAQNPEQINLVESVDDELDLEYTFEDITFVDSQRRDDCTLFDQDDIMTSRSISEGQQEQYFRTTPERAVTSATTAAVAPNEIMTNNSEDFVDMPTRDIRSFLLNWTESEDEETMGETNDATKSDTTISLSTEEMVIEDFAKTKKFQRVINTVPQDEYRRWMLLKEPNIQKAKKKRDTILCIKQQ